eukprot:1273710-Pyramimonas_sp.AAC.1
MTPTTTTEGGIAGGSPQESQAAAPGSRLGGLSGRPWAPVGAFCGRLGHLWARSGALLGPPRGSLG